MYNKAIPRMFNLQEKYAINNSKKPFHPVFEIRSLLLRKLFFTFTLQQIYNLQNITDLKPANLRIFDIRKLLKPFQMPSRQFLPPFLNKNRILIHRFEKIIYLCGPKSKNGNEF